MQFTCSQEQFHRGLNIVGKAVSTRTTMPVLNNILLATDEGRLKLTATNQEVGITYWLPCHVERDGAITIPARLLTEFVSSLPNEDITIDVNEANYTAHLRCGRYEADLRGMRADEFPTLPTLSGAPLAQLPTGLLREMITQVSFAASTDENRRVLAGVLMRFQGRQLTMTAADGFRLAVRRAELEQPVGAEGEVSIIIPARAMNELGRVLLDAGAGEDTPVSITVTPNGNQVLFHTPNLNVTSRLVGENYVNYEQIIPSEWKTRTTATTADLLKAVRIASYFAKDNAGMVRLSINPAGDLEPGMITISATAAEVGSNQTQLDVMIDGEGGQIAFNAKYVLEVLSVINTPTVAMETQTSGTPGVFKPISPDNSYVHIIMPMHLPQR